MVTTLSKAGLGSCGRRSNPIEARLSGKPFQPGLGESISNHGDTAPLKEIEFRDTAKPDFELNIPR